MVSESSAAASAALCAAVAAVELFSALDQSAGAGTTGSSTSAQAPSLGSAIQVLLPLAATVTLFIAVACIYRHLHRAGGGGGGNRRLPELVTLTLCASAGILVFSFFVQPGYGIDDAAQARALGMAAVGTLPAAAAVTFFLSMTLVFAAHVRVGGEGGGGAFAVGDGSVQTPVRLLTKMALGAAAALVSLMTMAIYTNRLPVLLDGVILPDDAQEVDALAELLQNGAQRQPPVGSAPRNQTRTRSPIKLLPDGGARSRGHWTRREEAATLAHGAQGVEKATAECAGAMRSSAGEMPRPRRREEEGLRCHGHGMRNSGSSGSAFVHVPLVLDARERRLAETNAVTGNLRDEIRAREWRGAEIRRAAESEAPGTAQVSVWASGIRTWAAQVRRGRSAPPVRGPQVPALEAELLGDEAEVGVVAVPALNNHEEEAQTEENRREEA